MERIPCNPETPCTLRDTTGCFEDEHHEAYLKRDYRTKTEKKFRNHIMNRVMMCRMMHNDEHAQWLIPRKPSPQEMKKLMEDYDNGKDDNEKGAS